MNLNRVYLYSMDSIKIVLIMIHFDVNKYKMLAHIPKQFIFLTDCHKSKNQRIAILLHTECDTPIHIFIHLYIYSQS